MPRVKEKKEKSGENFAKELEKASTLYSFVAEDEKRNINWLAISGLAVFGLVLIAYFIYVENFLGAFLFLLAIFTVFMTLRERKNGQTKKIKCKIKSQGVQVNNTLYPYENLKSFWIFYNPPFHQELSIRSQKTLVNYIKVPLGNADPVKIRELLLEFLPEKRQEEALVDALARNIGL